MFLLGHSVIALLREQMLINRPKTMGSYYGKRPFEYTKPEIIVEQMEDSQKSLNVKQKRRAAIPELINAINIGDYKLMTKYSLVLASDYVLKVIQSSMNMVQAFGPLYVMLMISALFSDILTNYHPSVSLEMQSNMSNHCHSKEDSISIQSTWSESMKGSVKPHKQKYEARSTIEVLVQMRDALILMKEVFSIDQLLLLVFEL